MSNILELSNKRFVLGSIDSLLGTSLLNTPDWEKFQDYWNHLEIDEYMNDGGKYRYRRFGRFRWKKSAPEVVLQAYRPYRQPTYFNPLNGDIDRYFSPVTSEMSENPIVQAVLLNLGKYYAELEDVEEWKVNAYFNRIIATTEELGKPVPEGMHRDGVKFSCLLMVNRLGFSGGETTLFDLMTKEPIFTGALSNAGDALILRDDTVFHDTTAISLNAGFSKAYRDLLVIEFY
jgi:hypothetical protein